MMRVVEGCLVCVCMVLMFPAGVVASTFTPSRVHLMDVVGNNWLFRGSVPLNANQTYVWDDLVGTLKTRAEEEGRKYNRTLSDTFALTDVCLLSSEVSDANAIRSFMDANPALGSYVHWPTLGGVVRPRAIPKEALRRSMAKADVWKLDNIPHKATQLSTWMNEQDPEGRTRVYYMHCEAGCDRTGQMAAAYYMGAMRLPLTEAWERDVAECGRAPNNFSVPQIEWYCEWNRYYNGGSDTNCTVNI